MKILNNFLESIQNNKNLHNKILKFFKNNPNPDDSLVHQFADKLGIEPDKFETHIYMILSELLKIGPVGRHNNVDDSKFDSNELKMGIKVEYEHTDNPDVAKEIAKDHLAECADYYTRLAKMEKECGVE